MATLIPLGDVSRRPSRFAVVTLLIILTNVYVFLRELIEGNAFVRRWAVIPAHIDHGRHLITLVTGTFLHAGWLHIGGNMVFLWAFGPGWSRPRQASVPATSASPGPTSKRTGGHQCPSGCPCTVPCERCRRSRVRPRSGWAGFRFAAEVQLLQSVRRGLLR